jgi:hypothetical protein
MKIRFQNQVADSDTGVIVAYASVNEAKRMNRGTVGKTCHTTKEFQDARKACTRPATDGDMLKVMNYEEQAVAQVPVRTWKNTNHSPMKARTDLYWGASKLVRQHIPKAMPKAKPIKPIPPIMWTGVMEAELAALVAA